MECPGNRMLLRQPAACSLQGGKDAKAQETNGFAKVRAEEEEPTRWVG